MLDKKILGGLSLVFVFFILFSNTSALQEPTYRACLNDTHLFEEKEIFSNLWGVERWNETTHCAFGCHNADCYEPYDVQAEIFIAIAFFCAIIALMFGYLTIKTGDSGDRVLPILFIALCILFAMLGVFSLVSLGSDSSLDNISSYMLIGYQILSGTFIIVIFYVIISYVVSVFGLMDRLVKKTKFKKKHKTGKY